MIAHCTEIVFFTNSKNRSSSSDGCSDNRNTMQTQRQGQRSVGNGSSRTTSAEDSNPAELQ